MTVTSLIPRQPTGEDLSPRTPVPSFESKVLAGEIAPAREGEHGRARSVSGSCRIATTLLPVYDVDWLREVGGSAILLAGPFQFKFAALATAGTVHMAFFDEPFVDTFGPALHVRERERERIAVEVAPRQRAKPPSRAYRAFEEVAQMLGQSTAETAELLGLHRGTIYAWRAGREPQPRNARRLYRTHTLLKTLTRRLGDEHTLGWLATGDPTPLAMLADGDFAGVDRRASALIFAGEPAEFERVDAYVDESPDAEPADEPSPEARQSTPAPRRMRRRAPRRASR
jgi:hypothetical protein